jgi:hypothetical protein
VKKSIYISIGAVLMLPLMAYMGLQAIDPIDPDIVYVKRPSLFAGKWDKTGYSDNFTEYIDQSKLEVNLDSTINIVSMRNYFDAQVLDEDDARSTYKSQVSYETVDCFNQTITVSKMYYLAEHFASGSLINEPVEPVSTPIQLREKSVGLRKVRTACKLANRSSDSEYVKSSFMNNI